jgi:VanZ family protein
MAVVLFPPLSPDQFSLIHFYFRKIVGHLGNYGFLYFLWFRAFRGQLGCRQGRAFLYSLTLCLGIALTDEGHQALLASRTGSIRDVALDIGGSSLSALITLVFRIPRVRPLAIK